METKLDGERIQCHIQDGVVKFFTRNSNNYTKLYGPQLYTLLKDNIEAQAAILDGEVIVWDTLKNEAAPFGQNKPVALRTEPLEDHLQLCYKVFDILYIKGPGDDSEEVNLMGARLKDRKVVLERVVREVPQRLEVVRGRECLTVEEVFEEFNQSVYRNEEGIMIKRLDSTYKPNERSNNWIKLKGEYIDSIGDSLDLVIIGGYFGERKRIGGGQDWTDHINVFLCGAI